MTDETKGVTTYCVKCKTRKGIIEAKGITMKKNKRRALMDAGEKGGDEI